jgi:hypothetical protein
MHCHMLCAASSDVQITWARPYSEDRVCSVKIALLIGRSFTRETAQATVDTTNRMEAHRGVSLVVPRGASRPKHTGTWPLEGGEGMLNVFDTSPTNCSALALKWSERLKRTLGRTPTLRDVAVLAAQISVGLAQRQGLRRLAVDDVLRDAGAYASLKHVLTTEANHRCARTMLCLVQPGGLTLTRSLAPALAQALASTL